MPEIGLDNGEYFIHRAIPTLQQARWRHRSRSMSSCYHSYLEFAAQVVSNQFVLCGGATLPAHSTSHPAHTHHLAAELGAQYI